MRYGSGCDRREHHLPGTVRTHGKAASKRYALESICYNSFLMIS
jgi:hypothetical protein